MSTPTAAAAAAGRRPAHWCKELVSDSQVSIDSDVIFKCLHSSHYRQPP